jgi:hypothetical protein
MAKAKTKQVVIPKFSSEAEEAAWWDRHRSEVEIEIRGHGYARIFTDFQSSSIYPWESVLIRG